MWTDRDDRAKSYFSKFGKHTKKSVNAQEHDTTVQ
jgi:hypothetical protein